jgi:PAT family beta-lactamase induction signal transducer AmpG
MGLANTTYGYLYAVPLVTVPQQLAARGVPEPEIANIGALVMAVSLATFALAPVLDTSMSRRRWSVSLGLLATILALAVLLLPTASPLLAPGLAVAALVTSLYNAAIGGWLGAALPKSCDETVGTWFGIGNALGFSLARCASSGCSPICPRRWGRWRSRGSACRRCRSCWPCPALGRPQGHARDLWHAGPRCRASGKARPGAADCRPARDALRGLHPHQCLWRVGRRFSCLGQCGGAANGVGQMVACLLGAPPYAS